MAGNFHIAPGESLKEYHSHVHDLHMISPGKFNSTHRFEHFSFGEAYPDKQYPLDGVTTVATEGGTMHQYYVQVSWESNLVPPAWMLLVPTSAP